MVVMLFLYIAKYTLLRIAEPAYWICTSTPIKGLRPGLCKIQYSFVQRFQDNLSSAIK